MPLSPSQTNALNQLKEQLPVDAVPGFSISSSGEDPTSKWTKKMASYSGDLAANAYAYYNFNVRSNGPLKSVKRKPSKIISPEGFPPDIVVTYTYPPPLSFYSLNKEREVKHFVLHSFGHMWHATAKDGKMMGWLNSSSAGKGVTPYQLDGKTVYVAAGSDPNTLAHFARFSAGLSACLASAAQASAHFFIDRDGNLVVIGDCNDVLFTSQGISETSCGVELEEAFYIVDPPLKGRENAIWKPGGNPPGTAGNIKYFTYSDKQLLTLSILCKKLETVYPKMRERNLSFTRGVDTKGGPGGYTMHDWIKGSKHMDVSPHFLTQSLWDSFFKLVDSHTHINVTNVFKPRQKYEDSNANVSSPSSTSTVGVSRMFTDVAKVQGEAYDRARVAANKTRSDVNSEAGKDAVRQAKANTQKEAVISDQSKKTHKPYIDGFANTVAVGTNGKQVNSDDMWG